MEIVLQVKRIGNSYGIIIPKSVAKELDIKEGDKVIVSIKKPNLMEVFGIIKE